MNWMKPRDRTHYEYCFQAVGSTGKLLLVSCLAVLGSQQRYIAAQAETVQATTYEATWKSLDSRPTPSWFQDSKFGIFIHFILVEPTLLLLTAQFDL